MDGTVRFNNISPAEYVVHTISGPPGTYVASLTFNGQDLLTQPMNFLQGGAEEIRVELHPNAAEVDGIAQPEDQPSYTELASPTGGTVTSPMVVLVPKILAADGTGWLIAPVQPSGSFSIENVRPGHYTAFAVQVFDASLWQNVGFRSEIENQGVGIDVDENDRAQVRLLTISNGEIQQVLIRAGIQQ